MKNAFILSFSLGLVCTVAAAILTVGHNLTSDAQQKAQMAEQLDAMSKLFPNAEFSVEDEPVAVRDEQTGVTFEFYPAMEDGALRGVVGKGATMQGFGGRVDVMIGIDPDDDEIIKTLVVGHKETPGLGTQATERMRRKTLAEFFNGTREEQGGAVAIAPNEYLDQYDGKTAPASGAFNVVKSEDAVKAQSDVLAVSGATITSRAVADAVARTMNAYRNNKQTILTAKQD